MTTNQNPLNILRLAIAIIVTLIIAVAIGILFSGCVAGNYSKYNHFKEEGRYKDRRLMKHIADSLYKTGDSSCFVMQKDGKWCLNCKDSLKFSK